MSLRDKQSEFAKHVPALIVRAFDMGYQVTLGDAYRDPRAPYGSQSSRHRMRLAIDLNLFKLVDGRWVYQESTRAHLELGEWWEEQGGIWGGRFGESSEGAGDGWDGNHYEWPLA